MKTPRATLSTGNVNSYGFRLLPEGGQWARYRKNAVLLLAHKRLDKDKDKNDSVLPLGRVEDIRLENGVWTGQPVFHKKTQLSRDVSELYEGGDINAFSISFEPLKASKDPRLMLPGQKLPTVTEWRVEEVSITDVQSDFDAVADRGDYDLVNLSAEGETIDLSAEGGPAQLQEILLNKTPNNMDEDLLNLIRPALNLSATADQAAAMAAIRTTAATAAKVPGLETELSTARTERDGWKSKYETLTATTLEKENKLAVSTALSAGQITASQVSYWEGELNEPDETKRKARMNYLAALPKYKELSAQLVNREEPWLEEVKKMNWDTLYSKNLSAKLKELSPELYDDKFEEKHNRRPLNTSKK
jgi:hypothetical protein